MNIAGVICEFNPFHKGHKYLIDQMKNSNATHIAAIMSGSFVQRGDCAVMSKRARAECALKNGADLVLELPAVFSSANAARFALAGVQIAKLIGLNTLWFASECGDIDILKKAAAASEDVRVKEKSRVYLERGNTGIQSLTLGVRDIYGDNTACILKRPNNALGIEYLKAIEKTHSEITPVTIKRIGAGHDDAVPANNTASGSFIRDLLSSGRNNFSKYCDSTTAEIIKNQLASGYAPASLNNAERAILYKLRTMTPDDFSLLPDVSEGLNNRIFKAVQSTSSLNEIIDKVKTKRYTHSRIRRILLSAFLGLTEDMQLQPVEYIKPLLFNNKGAEILSRAKKINENTFIVTKPSASIKLMNKKSRIMLSTDIKSADLWGLCCPKIMDCGSDYINKVKANEK